MKNKLIIFFIMLMVIGMFVAEATAQTLSNEDIGTIFNKAILREQFINKTNIQYYRFAKNIWYFDNLVLSYFPSETITELHWENPNNFGMNYSSSKLVTEKDWALLGREITGKASKQIIYLDKPSEFDVFHGLDFPRVNYLEDFYLYTDLFLLDSYPEGSGSVYLYFSNSIIAGNRDSYGILIDPKTGIYKASNNYDYYNLFNKTKHSGFYYIGFEQHGLELIKEFDPTLYEGKIGSIGNDIYPNENIDGKFLDDYEALKQNAIKEGLPDNISVYRIELTRLEGKTSVYINGVFVAELNDGITTDGYSYVSNRNGDQQYIQIHGKRVDLLTISHTEKFDDIVIKRLDDDTWSVYNPSTINKLVSWTVGPRLYAGGEIVTMAVGNMIIFSNK